MNLGYSGGSKTTLRGDFCLKKVHSVEVSLFHFAQLILVQISTRFWIFMAKFEKKFFATNGLKLCYVADPELDPKDPHHFACVQVVYDYTLMCFQQIFSQKGIILQHLFLSVYMCPKETFLIIKMSRKMSWHIVVFTNKRRKAKVYTVYFGISSV